MRLDLNVKIKYESTTIILFVGIIYSLRDLLSDLNNLCLTLKLAIYVIRYMMSSLPLASASLSTSVRRRSLRTF